LEKILPMVMEMLGLFLMFRILVEGMQFYGSALIPQQQVITLTQLRELLPVMLILLLKMRLRKVESLFGPIFTQLVQLRTRLTFMLIKGYSRVILLLMQLLLGTSLLLIGGLMGT
jgi:hypothetical protein